MKKKILYILLVLILVSGTAFFLGYFYHAYRYRTKIAAGQNWQATQYLNSLEYPDVTNGVEITCNFGNKQTFEAKSTSLQFTQNDFDSSGKFIGYDKNFLIQQVCGISNSEGETVLNQAMKGDKEVPALFNVTLIN